MNAFCGNFGKMGSLYDFTAVDIGKLRDKARKLKQAGAERDEEKGQSEGAEYD
jgi:hypothetical protein